MRLARIWSVAAAVAAGTFWGCLHHSAAGAGAAALCGAGLLLLHRPTARAVGLGALALGLGWLSAGLRCETASVLTHIAERAPFCDFSGRILEGAGGLGTLAKLARIDCHGYEPVLNPGVAMLDGPSGAAGSSISGHGWLLPLGNDGFGRARARAGAHAALDPTEIELTTPSSGPQGVAAGARRNLELVTRPLEDVRAALLRGLVVGDSESLDPAVLESFRRAGLSHLLAVSGSNVAIVLGAVTLALRRLALLVRVLTGAGALGLYLLVVGPEPSVLRASVMGAIALAALAAGARTEPLAALGVAVTILICLRPQLVYSVGLHLSVAATAGIVLWGNALIVRLEPLPRLLTLPLGTSLAAQAAVAPLLISTFGELSLVAPAANLLAAPAVAPATVLGLAAGLSHGLHPAAGALLARLAEPWAAWILLVGESFGAPSWAAVTLPNAVGWLAAACVSAGVWITVKVISPQ